ncbi:MAG: PAC2 family protein [Gordonia sp. (in: high G+C Gram-positive bacteria)]|uniref:proteasome assembly chaperone family protein n=1 Tax=Gordonia sp. (in: high G+C Gram-positive bacteria) TaxID=84139 RepID=UPI0039E6810F
MVFEPAEHDQPENSSLYELEFPEPQVSQESGGPVLIHALDGFADAGNAVALAAQHLRDSLDAELVATFHTDELIDYRSRRPVMDFSGQAFTGIEMPSLTVHAIRDNAGKPFLLLSGSEPDLRWEGFTAAVRGLSDRFGVSDVVGLNAIPMAVPHTRPSTITAHGSDVDFLGDLPRWGSPMKLPASASMMLELRLGEHGYRTSGISVHVPHYLAQSGYPAASARLLATVGSLTGLDLPTKALESAADTLRVQIDKELEGNSEVSSVVEALESQYDAYTEAADQQASLLAADEPLPSADELGDEFQRYLAEQARESGNDPDGTESGSDETA